MLKQVQHDDPGKTALVPRPIDDARGGAQDKLRPWRGGIPCHSGIFPD
jgi:hypothetical protein